MLPIRDELKKFDQAATPQISFRRPQRGSLRSGLNTRSMYRFNSLMTPMGANIRKASLSSMKRAAFLARKNSASLTMNRRTACGQFVRSMSAYPFKSGGIADIALCPRCATTRLMHRSEQHLYSIASLARASNVCGTQRPSALAVVRLIRSSMRVSGKCRSTSLRRLLGQTSLKGHSFFNLTISVSLPLTPAEC